MEAYTGQMGRWRSIMRYEVEIIDTTVKTGTSIFAPNWDMVMDVKGGRITEAQYTEQYHSLITNRIRHYEGIVLQEVSRKSGCFCCMCPHGAFCHRLLLMPILNDFCVYQSIPFIYKGELGA
jgi:hypothetical protein